MRAEALEKLPQVSHKSGTMSILVSMRLLTQKGAKVDKPPLKLKACSRCPCSSVDVRRLRMRCPFLLVSVDVGRCRSSVDVGRWSAAVVGVGRSSAAARELHRP